MTMAWTGRRLAGWALSALLAAVAIYFFGFVALTVVCLVVGGVFIRGGLSTQGWPRAWIFLLSLMVLALPVLVYLEAANGFVVVTGS